MYTFTNTATRSTHSYRTLNAAMRAKDAQDTAYGAVCTTWPMHMVEPMNFLLQVQDGDGRWATIGAKAHEGPAVEQCRQYNARHTQRKFRVVDRELNVIEA